LKDKELSASPLPCRCRVPAKNAMVRTGHNFWAEHARILQLLPRVCARRGQGQGGTVSQANGEENARLNCLCDAALGILRGWAVEFGVGFAFGVFLQCEFVKCRQIFLCCWKRARISYGGGIGLRVFNHENQISVADRGFGEGFPIECEFAVRPAHDHSAADCGADLFPIRFQANTGNALSAVAREGATTETAKPCQLAKILPLAWRLEEFGIDHAFDVAGGIANAAFGHGASEINTFA
jgi:hypothetical protein